jgi:hypothetical protein
LICLLIHHCRMAEPAASSFSAKGDEEGQFKVAGVVH